MILSQDTERVTLSAFARALGVSHKTVQRGVKRIKEKYLITITFMPDQDEPFHEEEFTPHDAEHSHGGRQC